MDYVPDENLAIKSLARAAITKIDGGDFANWDAMHFYLNEHFSNDNQKLIFAAAVEAICKNENVSHAAKDFFARSFLDFANEILDGSDEAENQENALLCRELCLIAIRITTENKTRKDAIDVMLSCFEQTPTKAIEKYLALRSAACHVSPNDGVLKKLGTHIIKCEQDIASGVSITCKNLNLRNEVSIRTLSTKFGNVFFSLLRADLEHPTDTCHPMANYGSQLIKKICSLTLSHAPKLAKESIESAKANCDETGINSAIDKTRMLQILDLLSSSIIIMPDIITQRIRGGYGN